MRRARVCHPAGRDDHDGRPDDDHLHHHGPDHDGRPDDHHNGVTHDYNNDDRIPNDHHDGRADNYDHHDDRVTYDHNDDDGGAWDLRRGVRLLLPR